MDNRVYQDELIIYFSLNEIDYNYIVIATIELKNNTVYGDLNYDDRIRRYLLNRINGIGADALIYNDSLSDSTYTYFDAIYYIKNNDSNNPIIN